MSASVKASPSQHIDSPFRLGLILNVVYLIAFVIMRRRYENAYGPISRALLFLLPAAAILGLTVR